VRIPEIVSPPVETDGPLPTLPPLEIRFDPPQPWNEGRRYHAPASDIIHDDFEQIESPTTKLFPRSETRRPSVARLRADLLPESNPFQPLGSSSDAASERLTPVAQFMLLFVLFTAAGTSLLLMNQSSTEGRSPNKSAEHRLEQVDPAVAVPTAVTAAPTLSPPHTVEIPPLPVSAVGPVSDVPRVRPGSPSWPNFSPTMAESSTTNDYVPSVARAEDRPAGAGPRTIPATPRDLRSGVSPTTTPATDAPVPMYPSTGIPATVLPVADGGTLPQVRTDDPPTAIAKLNGSVAPVQQR
jgi:hypothetical protein